MDNDPWNHPTKHIAGLLLKHSEVVITVGSLVSVAIAPYLAGHSLDSKTILSGIFLFLIMGVVYFAITRLVKKPSIRHKWGFCNQFEGTWIEKFSLSYEGENESKGYISVFSLNPDGKTLQMTGYVYSESDLKAFSRFTGKKIYEESENKHIVYKYSTVFIDKNRETAKGYGVYDFRKGPGSDVLDLADGEFVELVGGKTAHRNQALTSVERISSDVVNKILGENKYYPHKESEFKKILEYYTDQIAK